MMAVPTSLFRYFFLRKVDKSELGREIKKIVRNIMPDYATQFPPDSIPVIAGGWLLHFIRWKKNATYADVLGQYSSFLRTNYGMCCVLFDGYEYDSTKDHEYKRRQSGKVSASIVIAENAHVHRDQQAFFSNEKNKTNFVSLLTTHLWGTGHQVEEAVVMQIHSLYPVRLNSLGMVTVVAEDTDVLIMLVYHWRNCMEDIFIRKESRLSTPGEIISMKDATSSIPVVTQRHILLIHAWSGCDTTSATFGHGKMYLMKMLNRVPEVQNLSTIVSDQDETILLMKLDMLDSVCFACSMVELRRIHKVYDNDGKVKQGCATMIATNGACST